MNCKKIFTASKRAGECCITGSGVASLLFTVICLFTAVAPMIVLPIVAAAGIGFGIWGFYRSWKQQSERERILARSHQRGQAALAGISEVKKELHDMRRELHDVQMLAPHPVIQLTPRHSHGNGHRLFRSPSSESLTSQEAANSDRFDDRVVLSSRR